MLKLAYTSGARSEPRLARWLCPTCTYACRWQYRYASTAPRPAPPSDPPVFIPPTVNEGKDLEAPILKPLNRPIGQIYPPKPGENSPVDLRSLRERRDDILNPDKNLARRKELTRQYLRPYFRDWTSTRYHKGKTWLATAKLFKAESALYFPNLVGYTLADPRSYQNTTSLLNGKVSVIILAQEQWAENQARSFAGDEENPALATELEQWKGQGLQRVHINLEEDMLKAMLVWLFLGHAKKKTPKEEWPRSLVVRKGVTHDIKQMLGMTNSKIGHVYLVDQDCKIRWAGNADANDEEREGLVKVVRRLMEKTVARKQEKENLRNKSGPQSLGGRRRR